MNILLINHYAGSPKHGMEYRPYYLAKEWVRMGHKVYIVASSISHLRSISPNVTDIISHEVIDGISYSWLKTPGYNGNGVMRAINMFSFVANLMLHAGYFTRTVRPNIVIASSTYPLDILPARSISKRSSATLIFEVHDLWPLSPIELGGMSPRHPFIIIMQWAENYAYKYADKVTSILPNTKHHMVEHGMKPDKFVYIPNGISIEDWERYNLPLPEQHEKVLSELKRKSKFLVCYAGAHGIANALTYFIEAAKYLVNENISFVLVGQGPEKPRLQNLAEQLKLTNVVFLSPVNKHAIPALLDKMDCLYISLQKQNLFRFGISPNKLMDYMMAAMPIIHAVEAANDMVKDANCGISVPAENPEAIASAVKQLMRMSDEQRREMGLRGKRYVMENHDYKVLARRFLESIQG